MTGLIVVAFVALGCAAWTAQLAENRGRNPVPWGFVGLFTGIIGVIIAACLRPTVEAEASRLEAVEAARPAKAPASIDALARLVELHDAGKLTDDEFVAAKRQLLGL